MDRATRLLRRTWVLSGTVAVLLAVLLLRGATTAESLSGERLKPTFPAIEVAKVRALEVERTVTRDGKSSKESVRLARSGAASWILESAYGYPADAKKVEDYLKSLSGVRTKSSPTSVPAKFKSFAGPDGWTDVRVFADGEAPIVSFGIGKGGAEGSWSNVFLRVDDVGKAGLPLPTPPAMGLDGASPPALPALPATIVAVTGMDTYGNRTEASAWVDARIWPGLSENEIVEISWSHPPKSFEGALARGTKGEKDAEEPWTLVRPEAGKAVADTARQYAQSFAGMLFAGVEDGRPGPETDAKFGFDKPDLVVTATGKAAAEGQPAPTWRLEIGKKIEGKGTWAARRIAAGKPDPWTFSVNDFDVSRFRDDPKTLLDAPPKPPEPAAMGDGGMDGAGMDGATTPDPAMGEGPTPPAMGEEAPMAEPPAMGEEAGMGEAPPPPPEEKGKGPEGGEGAPK